jgi:tetratricopeptide (TPR) repeat protein
MLAGGATAVALALGGLTGGVLAESRPAASAPRTPPAALAERALSVAGGGVGGVELTRLEAAVRATPRNPKLLTQLGFAYQLRWRETSDASFLPRSEGALRRSLRLDAGDPETILGLGSLALIRHEFRAALRHGRRAERLLPGSYRPYAVIGDALVELGRYDEAFAAFETMASRRPGLASYARVAYARELVGDRAGAVAAMRLALEAAAGQPEPSAWAHVELAKLGLGSGRVQRAAQHARAALAAFPGYPSARLELARSEVAAGRLTRALEQARRAAEATPTPESLAFHAELLERAGRPAEARRQRATIAVIERLLRAGGVEVDLEAARYRADNRIRPAATVALARAARTRQPSIQGDDVLAWALARAGRCEEALPFARRALRLGTRDALLFFHRGYAEGCAGNPAAMREWYARALELSPVFSLRWAPVAQAAVSG